MTIHGLPDVPAKDLLDQIVAHLGAACAQSLPSDDQIIMDHVRAAHELAKIVLRRAS